MTSNIVFLIAALVAYKSTFCPDNPVFEEKVRQAECVLNLKHLA